MIAGETAGRQGVVPPPPYVERFRRFRPAVMVTVGVVALVMSSVWLVRAARSAHLGEGPPALALLFTSIAMVGLGAARLNQLLSQPDLELHVWEQLRELDGRWGW